MFFIFPQPIGVFVVDIAEKNGFFPFPSKKNLC